LVGIGEWCYVQFTYPTTQPLTAAKFFIERLMKPHVSFTKQTIGFLPYWRIDDMQYLKLNNLTEVTYFGLTPNAEGHIVQQLATEREPGYREWEKPAMKDFIAKTQIMGADFTVTITALDNGLIEQILDNPTVQQTLITEISNLVTTNKLNGVILDFEYSGEPDDKYQTAFTSFSQQLSKTLKKTAPHVTMSLAVMPAAGKNKDIFDFSKLIPLYKNFIVMSYEYYGANSDIAGPIAPMKGFKEGKYFFDVQTTYEDFKKIIPSDKLIMGVPYYGWDVAVIDGKTANSPTFPKDNPNNYAAVMSYARMREDKNLKPDQCDWDEIAQESWCWYTDENNIDHQVWFEDAKSLGIKYDFVNQQKLGGIAIWVLGYDKAYPDLWSLLQKKFSPQKK
jgi:spore germination protein